MKYIITESQLIVLKENNLPLWLKRRLSSSEKILPFIENAQLIHGCEDFSDEFEYADNIVSMAVDDFLTSEEDFIEQLEDDYDYVHDMVVDIVKEMFGDTLFEEYYSQCGDNSDESDDGDS